MSTIDYMKVIDVLAKTMKLENIDMKFPDKSINKFTVTMDNSDKTQKVFHLTVLDANLILIFSKNYLINKEFNKWLAAFEYELEQSFFKNFNIQIDKDVTNYILKISF